MSRQIPPLNPLRAFEVAARHLSFTRAAEELFVTPSAVSHQIKALEESLGVQLFIREAKALVLTPAGNAYLPSVQLAFKQLADATHRLHSKDRPALKVNMPPTFAVKWLIPRMDRFMKAHPDIDLKVSTSNHRIDFERDDFDMAIRYGRGDYPGLHCELCMAVEVIPVCSPALLQGPQPLETPSDLKHHTLLHDDSTYTDVSNPDWAMWLEHAGVTDVDASRGPSFWPSHLVINAALNGLGVALVKKNWIEQDLAEGRLVRLFESIRLPVEFSYFVVFPKERLEDRRIRCFTDWIRAEVSSDQRQPAPV
ncbi:transcriptional regulator of glycine cleavage system operon, LysR family [Cupriavidus phytorum]|uniref:Transcriptional regulator of glycine cleavage system operon, LysR family n=2 Tax=Cupriavidus TaxID=106589 RepID=A0A375C2V9_9BURK|nr:MULTISPECIES: transcriptional regulator GcvA [Cupriavidus]PZX32382.1 LysR family glycine cleavage system transcriptional activator [Cupriavidus alkaliphilus]SOY61775.1 transcriptional regulator of glycine cleavage system operon, LysR family [Cupriavidus taiwanensis]